MTQQEVKEKCLRKRIECLEQREKEYEQQLAEKDEEIKLLKCEMVEYQVENEQLKMLGCEAFIRHQICEEIREKLDTVYGEKQFGLVYLENIKIMLDQIENK